MNRRLNTARASAELQDSVRETAGTVAIKITEFAFQTFFDDTQQLQAVLVQPNSLIVQSTLTDVSLPGYGVALHPDSMVPLAVQFKTNVEIPDSSTYFLTPGQTLFPHDNPFSGIRYGLPFGWLGGGTAHLLIFKTPQARVFWSQAKVEVPFQRFRIAIEAAGSPTFQSVLPLRFPSPNVQRYNTTTPSAPFDQSGRPSINVQPTRTIMQLQVQNLAAAHDILWLVQGPQHFEATSIVADQFTFPTSGAYFPTVEFEAPTVYYGGNDAEIAVTDAGDGSLVGEFIDVVRYGLI